MAELEEVYSSYDPKDVILAGFSFGAVTALAAAANKNPSELWLFSLSPYFAEDMPKIKASWKKDIGLRKINALNQLTFLNLTPKILCHTLLFMGTEEAKDYPPSRERVEGASRLFKNNKLIYVDGVDHDIADKRYIASIEKAI